MARGLRPRPDRSQSPSGHEFRTAFPPGKSPCNAGLRRLVRGRGSRRHVPARRYAPTKAAERNPRLRPAWEIALQDDVLTRPEVKVILESAGEKAEADE